MVKLSKVSRIPEKRYVYNVPNPRILQFSAILNVAPPYVSCVYRGVSGMRLPKCFWIQDLNGARGGVEFGFLSTTTKREVKTRKPSALHPLWRSNTCAKTEVLSLSFQVAMQYISDGKALATIFEISVGMIDRGSSISFLSQFPGEEEVLMPPRCLNLLFLTPDPSLRGFLPKGFLMNIPGCQRHEVI